MKKDLAIEEVRKTRHEISRRFGHDARALVRHYQMLGEKYAGRIMRDPGEAYRVPQSSEQTPD